MRVCVVICFLYFPSLLWAQTTVGSFFPKNKPTELAYKVSRPNKNVIILFQNDSEYELMFIDSAFRSSKSFTYTQVDKHNRFTSYLETDSMVSLYFIHLKTGKFSVLTFSKQDSSFSRKALFAEENKEHFLKAVQVKDKICALSVNDGNNDLIVKTYRHSNLLARDTFKIEFPTFMESLKSNINTLNQESFSDIGITNVDYEVEQDISGIYTDRKLYVRDDKLIMIFDQKNTSHLIILDLVKKKSYYKKFSFKLDLETAATTNSGNSFLYKDYFFRVTSNGHQINLAVVDFRTFKLIRNHNVYDNQTIEIKNGPLLREESTNGSVPKVEPIKSTEKFFKIIRGADLGVTAHQNTNSTYELTIGSHFTEVYASPIMGNGLGMGMGGMGMGMGGMGVGIGMGGMGGMGGPMMDPYYYPYGMMNRSYNVSIEKAYFHSILTDKEFAHVPAPLENSYLDRKKAFWDRNFRSGRVPEIDVEYQWKDKMHYGYWDKKNV